MAGYTATSATTRGSVYVAATPSPSPVWLDEARDNVWSIAPSPVNNADFNEAVEASYLTLVAPNPSPPPGTPGSYQAVCSRYFAAFSTTGVPTQATSIQLYIHTITSADNGLRIVKASAPSTTGPGVTGGNYKAIPGLTAGTGMGGLVTDYAGPLPSPSLGWNAIPLNATAISDFNSQPALQIAVVDSAYDYDYTEPTFPSIQRTGISSLAPFSPYLLVETGLGQWVLSINPSLAAKVNPVSQANIKLVNRVGQFDFGSASNGIVSVVQLQPDGKILLGGSFTTFNGGAANRIVRLNVDGSVDTTFVTGTGFNSFPNDIQVQSDGKILIVGSFSTYNSATVNGIVRLTSIGTLDTTFVTGTGFTTGSYPTRLKILNTGSYLVIGGFTNYKGNAAVRIVCLLPSGTPDPAFAAGSGFVGDPLTIEIQPADNKILIGGLMTSYLAAPCNTMIRLLPTGLFDTSFPYSAGTGGTGFNNSVRAIAVQSDGSILVHGLFSTYNGVACKTIAKLSNTGTLDTAYASAITRAFGLNGVYGPSGGSTPQVTNLHPLANGQVIATGWFNQWDGTLGSFPANIPISAIKLNANGTRDSSFTPEFGNLIRDSAMTPDENIIAGGDFSTWGATTVNYIVRINSNGIKNSLP